MIVTVIIYGIMTAISMLSVNAYTLSDSVMEENGKYFYKDREITSYEYTRLKNRNEGYDTYEDAFESVIEGYKCNEVEAAYMYIYLNDDDIPELLVMEGGENTGGGVIYYYADKKVKRVETYGSGFGNNGVFGYVPHKGRVLKETVNHTQDNLTVKKNIYFVDLESNYVEDRAEYIEQLGGKMKGDSLYRINGKYVDEDEYMSRWTSSAEGMIMVRYEDCKPIVKNVYECNLHNAENTEKNNLIYTVYNYHPFPMVWEFIAGDIPAYYGKYYEKYDEKEIDIKALTDNNADIDAIQINNMWDFNNGGALNELFVEGEYGGACFCEYNDRIYMLLRGEDQLYNLDYTELDGDMWLFTYAMPMGEWQNYEFWKFNILGEVEDRLRLNYEYDDYWINETKVKEWEWYKERDKMLKNAHHRSWIVGEKE